jgi:hypothetical protein
MGGDTFSGACTQNQTQTPMKTRIEATAKTSAALSLGGFRCGCAGEGMLSL